jgi:hypothetical protein
MKSNTSTKTRTNQTRVDDAGRARAGSQRQIQSYVNEHPMELSNAVRHSLSLGPVELEWVSPISDSKYAEYQDDDFLRVLGLEDLASALREFWPRGGPCWDALARISFS